MPPVAATVSPGTVRSASATECTCFARSSAPVMTVTVDDTCDSGISTCAAETTMDSETALTDSRTITEIARRGAALHDERFSAETVRRDTQLEPSSRPEGRA